MKELICMVKQSNWIYCYETTRGHRVAKSHSECIEPIDLVCKRDGARRTPFSHEVCLNLDKVEICLAQIESRSSRKTMDFSLGLKHNTQKRIALVELRLRYRNINNLSKTELDSKINNSITILGHSPNILNRYYFVFSSQLKNQAHRNLRRLYANKSIVSGVDIKDLKEVLF